MSDSASPAFTLMGTDSSFQSRSKDIFDRLGVITEEHEAYERSHCVTNVQKNFEDKLLADSNAEEFKKPAGCAPKAKIPPVDQKKSNRWQHYDLSDVKCFNSDAANAAAAHEFLKSQEGCVDQNKCESQLGEKDERESGVAQGHIFKKPLKRRTAVVESISDKSSSMSINLACQLDHLSDNGVHDHEDTDLEADCLPKKICNASQFKAFKKKLHLRKQKHDEECSDEDETLVNADACILSAGMGERESGSLDEDKEKVDLI